MSVWTVREGFLGSVTSTAVKFSGGLVREPEHAAAISGELDDHAFAHVCEPVQLVMREQPHLVRWARLSYVVASCQPSAITHSALKENLTLHWIGADR